MEIFNNEEQAFLVFAMQGEANISTVKFKVKLKDLNIATTEEGPLFDLRDLMVIIQFEDDYLTNIPGTNIKTSIDASDLIIVWTIGEAMTLEAKDREFQVIIKNKKTSEIFKSYKTIFKVQKSIDSDNGDNNCDTTCIAGMLEQWNLKMQQIVDSGGDVEVHKKLDALEESINTNKNSIDDLSLKKADKENVNQELTKKASLTEDNYFRGNNRFETTINKPLKIGAPKNEQGMIRFYNDNNWVSNVTYMGYNPSGSFEIGAKGNLKLYSLDNNNIELNTGLGQAKVNGKIIATNEDLGKKLDKDTYNQEKEEFSTKTELDKKLDKTIYEEEKEAFALKNELSSKLDKSIYESDKANLATKEELEKKANINDVYNKTETYSKEEVDQKIKEGGTSVDTSQFLTKSKLSTESIDTLITDDKTIVGGINELQTEVNNKLDKGQAGNFINKGMLLQYQLRDVPTLATENKTIESAISELYNDLQNKANRSEINLGVTLSQYTKDKQEFKQELAKKAEINDSISTGTTTYSSSKINELVQANAGGGGSPTNIIEDSTTSSSKTWSSQKINEELSKKVNTETFNSELQNKASTSALTAKQDKTDQLLETTDKTIVGAINELDGKIKSSSETNLDNYYSKSEVDNKLNDKLDKSTYESEKTTFQLKNDESLETEAKTVSGAINELNAEKITLKSLSGVKGIEYNSENGQIGIKVDERTVKINDSGKLESLGGGGNSFECSDKQATIGEALKVTYMTSSTSNWTSGDFPYYKRYDRSRKDEGDLLLTLDKSNLDPSCSVLRIKPKISALTYNGSKRNASMSMHLITGGTYSYSSGGTSYIFTNTLSYNGFAYFYSELGDYRWQDNEKETFIFIPEIEKNNIYIKIHASEDSTATVDNIEVVQVLNTKPNLLAYRKDLSYQAPVKLGNSSLYIGGGGIAELTNGSSNLSLGFETFRSANTVNEKYFSTNTGIGNNISPKMSEGSDNTIVGYYNCPQLLKGSQNTIIGSRNCDYAHTSNYPNYNYIQEMNNSIMIGYYIQPKTSTPKNENIIGYYGKGNGDNTFTLGNNEITGLYAQVSSITQFSDSRIKKDVKAIDINTVLDNVKKIKVIHAGYDDLEEFIGCNNNDRYKLMFDGESYRNAFEKDTKLVDRIFHKIDPLTKKRKTIEVKTLAEDGEETITEEDELLEVENCIEITHNQLFPALVATVQYLLNELESTKDTIRQQNDLINRILKRIEVLENK